MAIFHDAIALRFPELTPAGTVARFPAYLRELLQFDGIAAVSADSRESLLDYWRWLGATQTPPVLALPLGVDPVPAATATPAPGQAGPVVLTVGTLEGRKNHLALLEACEQLVRELQAAGRPLRYDGPLTDDAVATAYAGCAFTVYPSLAEGFGLPVIESLAHGRPCICSARGALGEHSRQGGCLALDSVAADSLAPAIARLLEAPDELAALSAAARARTFPTWRTYAGELTRWMQSLPRR
ncbi:MAG: glycosyltransferase [Opitutales bacterium]|nr:glycosyltransferase [Opitutales bacterium]